VFLTLSKGVSQQPDATRFDGQCEEQENALSSVAEGLKKRPNTRHIARLLETAIEEDSLVQFVNRSETERYVVIHTGTKMYAYNLISGAQASIFHNSTEYSSGWTIPTDHYLYASNSPEKNINAISVGDSTFFVNKNITVAESANKTEDLVEEAVVAVIQGDYEKRYQVSFGDGSEQGAVFSITLEAVHAKGGNIASNRSVLTGDAYTTSPAIFGFYLPTAISIHDAGSGYTANLTDDTNTLSIRFNNSSNTSRLMPLKISTNANGEITAVSIPNNNTTNAPYSYSWHQNGNSEVVGGTSSNSVATITVKTGPADGASGGENASTERIAQGLGGDGVGGTNNTLSGTFPSSTFSRVR